jgi:hypothetical protein
MYQFHFKRPSAKQLSIKHTSGHTIDPPATILTMSSGSKASDAKKTETIDKAPSGSVHEEGIKDFLFRLAITQD